MATGLLATADPAAATKPAATQATKQTAKKPAVSRVSVSPVGRIAGERTVVRGRLLAATSRPVVLERKPGTRWLGVSSTRSKGRDVAIAMIVPARATLVRLRAPKTIVKRKNGRGKVVATRLGGELIGLIVVRPVAQTVNVTSLSWSASVEQVQVQALLRPSRPGRLSYVQSRVGGRWRTVVTARQTSAGRITSVMNVPAESVTVRVVAAPAAGAPAVGSPARTLTKAVRQQISRETTLMPGSQQDLDLSDELALVNSLGSVSSDGVSLTTDPRGGVVVGTTVAATPGERTVTARGVGCDAAGCARRFELVVGVGVTALQTTSDSDEFTVASADRRAAATTAADGLTLLSDEMLLTLGTPIEPGTLDQAREIADQEGAVVSGALADLGVYELRWVTPPGDLGAVVDRVRALPGVAAAARSVLDGASLSALPPDDWKDDGRAVTWPFTQIRAQQAWDVTTGSDTEVGIIESDAVFAGHEDLDVTDSHGTVDQHASHVAGLACAAANGKGVVGVAWGCPVRSIASSDPSDKAVLAAAREMAVSGVRVANISMGYRRAGKAGSRRLCVDKAESDLFNQTAQAQATPFRQLFNGPLGRNVVWTLAAGNNCGLGAHSPYGTSWALPNVVTVAASNSNGTLASYSNFGDGVEVAAPGGVGVGIAGGADGPISTVFKKCGLFGLSKCSDYAPMTGTSMAAPEVAGVAALVFSANPSLSAADAGSCIVATAGTGTGAVTSRSALPAMAGTLAIKPSIAFSGRIPIVDAKAAVDCARGATAGTGDVLIVGRGDRTSSGNGTDLGDLTAALESRGYRVRTATELPSELDGFGQLWYLDTEALSEEEQDRVAAYVARGHGLYLTGEWGCCSVDQSSIALLNRLVGGVEITHGGSGDGNGRLRPIKGLTTDPKAVSELVTANSGTLEGVPDADILAVDDSERTVAAAFAADEVSGGGRIAIVMDINWLAGQYRGDQWYLLVTNLAHFLQT